MGKSKEEMLNDEILKKSKEAGFKGKPIIVERYVDKTQKPTGIIEYDLITGRIALKMGNQLKIKPTITKEYFLKNFVKV